MDDNKITSASSMKDKKKEFEDIVSLCLESNHVLSSSHICLMNWKFVLEQIID